MESLVLYYEVQYLSMNIDRCNTFFTDNDMFNHVCTWKSMINIICSFDLFHIDYVLIVIHLYLSLQYKIKLPVFPGCQLSLQQSNTQDSLLVLSYVRLTAYIQY